MSTPFELQINGQPRELEGAAPSPLSDVVKQLGLRADRIAIELNGAIVPRTRWADTQVASGDKLEIVHFVGGGAAAVLRP